MKKDNLGDRMKGYENIERKYLIKRMPTLIRLDGKAFHTLTKGMKRPFDEVFSKTMWDTAKYLCENVMGCKLAYTQSDEITLILVDYDTLVTEAWFDKNVQKMASISASLATLAFNVNFIKNINELVKDEKEKEFYMSKSNRALFDSRVYNIPKEEVCNALIWRQQDATRNSILSVGQANFSFKQMQNKSCNVLQEMLFQEKGINWNDLPTYQKRGICVKKISDEYTNRTKWILDLDIPIFTQDRNYIDKFIMID